MDTDQKVSTLEHQSLSITAKDKGRGGVRGGKGMLLSTQSSSGWSHGSLSTYLPTLLHFLYTETATFPEVKNGHLAQRVW